MFGRASGGQGSGAPEWADELAAIVLPDHDGNAVRLGDLWRDGPAALVWLRHYGWAHCRDHAVQLHRARSKFDAAGVPVVLVGQATPHHAAHFRRRQGVDLPVLADQERVSYRAAGAKVGTAADLLGPKTVATGLARTVRSRGKVHQGRPVGNVAQLGGAMVIASNGRVAWSHMSNDASDNAEPDEILAAARRAANPS